jgi:myo-inositol 2-dehydrogenase/D-chiro-inositol 1-dehydrogenase
MNHSTSPSTSSTTTSNKEKPTRRNFMKTTGTVASAAMATNAVLSGRAVHASVDDTLKIGLVGCGGRGTGAAADALQADPYSKIVALADLFPDRMEQCRKLLSRQAKDRFTATDETCFSGMDAYKALIDSGVDVVLLCSPPHFRPAHLEYAVNANKHVFCEKPVATDPTGVRKVLETCRIAKEKNLNVVSGLCWRYDFGVKETIKRIKDGAIGKLIATQEDYLTGTLWLRERRPEQSDMSYQMLNWMYYKWLSGDHIVEQFIHSLDKSLWLHDDEPPVSAYGVGGRQVRNTPEYGDVYDHFSIVYEWKDGTRTFATTRQFAGCFAEVEDYVYGTKGTAKVIAHQIEGENAWKFDGQKPSMYSQEHNELFAAIRKGETINNGTYMSYSTLMAILGREVAYSGKRISWEEIMNSKQDLTPASYDGPAPEVVVPMPGSYKFV